MRVLLLLLSSVLLVGCAAQTKALGVWQLPDGQRVHVFQTTKGLTSVIGAFICHPIPERPHETGYQDAVCAPLAIRGK